MFYDVILLNTFGHKTIQTPQLYLKQKQTKKKYSDHSFTSWHKIYQVHPNKKKNKIQNQNKKKHTRWYIIFKSLCININIKYILGFVFLNTFYHIYQFLKQLDELFVIVAVCIYVYLMDGYDRFHDDFHTRSFSILPFSII